MRKKLTDCKYFFIDSGVLIDLLSGNTNREAAVTERIKQTKMFFDALQDDETFANQKKIFQISSISIAEIFHVDNAHENTLKAIANALDSQDLEILSFDLDTAVFHNQEYGSSLSNAELAKLKQDVNFPESGYTKEKIRKDHLIAATAKMYHSDVVLTNDSGFEFLCNKYDMFCHLFTDSPTQFLLNNGGDKIYDFNKKIETVK